VSAQVFVVDDDDAVRSALVRLLESDGHTVSDFSSAAAFLAHPLPAGPACLLLDMNMPEVSGLDVVGALVSKAALLPVIIITGFGSIPLTVQAMKAGAMEFLTKPVAPDTLLAAVRSALATDVLQVDARHELAELRQRHDSLTPREREVMQLVIGGLLNKQVAQELGVSEIMAKVHKRKVMDKMQARSLPDLVRVAERLNIIQSKSR
jgi:FixJ family two-component response regulator